MNDPQPLTSYEFWTLILQIIGTLATVAACIGIIYAKKSLDLARYDFDRKLCLETGAYALKCFIPTSDLIIDIFSILIHSS